MIYGNYTFRIKLEADAELPPYKGSTFRGVLGHALKRTVCALKKQECPACILRSNCTYALAFETAHALRAPENSRVSDPPHPMVIEPPLTTRTFFEKGETLEFRIILFGQINRNLPYFIYACRQMGTLGIGKKINGKRSRFTLESVQHKGFDVFDRDDNLSMPENLEHIDVETPFGLDERNAVTIKIKTPLRILKNDSKTPVLEFATLASSMIRRTTSLLNTYGTGEPDLDYPGLVDKARSVTINKNSLAWFDWKRYSAKQDRKMFMGGLTGEIEYKGDLKPFLPFLEASEKVHAGKNTAFGLGWLQLDQ